MYRYDTCTYGTYCTVVCCTLVPYHTPRTVRKSLSICLNLNLNLNLSRGLRRSLPVPRRLLPRFTLWQSPDSNSSTRHLTNASVGMGGRSFQRRGRARKREIRKRQITTFRLGSSTVLPSNNAWITSTRALKSTKRSHLAK